METLNNGLHSEDAGSLTEAKKELFDRLKTTMQKEVQEASTGIGRRGFLHALVGGSVVAGLSTLVAFGSSHRGVAATKPKNR